MTTNTFNRSLAIVLMIIALGSASAFAWYSFWGPGQESHPKPEAPPESQEPATPPSETPSPASGTVEIQTPEQAGVAVEDCIVYPDGTRLPPLNGVEKAPRISFHRRIPFTKIIGRHTDRGGVEWYVHENGARSTTRYQMRNGKREAVGQLTMPTTPSGIVGK